MTDAEKVLEYDPEDDEVEVPQQFTHYDRRRKGLRTEDVNALVNALQAGWPWEEAKQILLAEVQPKTIDGWRDHCMRVAGVHPEQVKPAAVPAVEVDARSPRDQKGPVSHG